MAQNIQLKRSALSGKVPDTGSLNLGEIAINTYDGKLYFKKSGSLQSIESIVTTNSINTGSITLTKTGSFGELVITQDVNIQRDLYVTNDIIGNGDIDVLGNITGSNLLIKGTLTAQSYIVSSSVVNMTTQFASGSTIFGNTSDDTHQFTGSVNITGSGYINSNIIITSADTGSFGTSGGSYPVSGVDYNTDLVTVQDFNSESGQFLIDYLYEVPVGTQVGLKGFLGNTSGSTLVVPANDYIAFVIDDVQVARITADGFEGVNFPPNVVSGSSQLTSSYDTRYVLSGSITQTTWDNIASKPSGIVSSSVQVLGGTNIISGSSQITPLLPSGIVSGSAQTIVNLPTGTVSGSIQVLGGTGIISSSAQLENATITNLTITNLTTVNETASVLFSSGSNRFGDFGNDTHSFTGSVQVSGSQTIVGTLTATTLNGTINATNGVVSGSSQILGGSGIVSGSSQITFSGISSLPTLVSGSSQVTASLDIRYSLSGSSGAVLDSRSRYLSQSSAATTWSFTHNIGSEYPMVTVYGSNNEIIQPEYVKTLSSNQTEIGFGTPVSGIAVASLGSLTEVTGRTIRQDFTASVSWSFVHNVGDKYVMVQAFDSADQMILPAEIRLASTTSSILTFPEAVSGYALATIGGDLPSISSSYEGYTLQVQSGLPIWTPIVSASVSNAVTASYILPSALPTGVISGSSQVTYINVSSIPAGIVSGSSQIILLLPTGVVSGSSQTITNLPTGTVSGSTQITYTSISSIPGGIVSGSSQITPLLPTGVVSSSTQTIANLPTGVVSGSSQILGGSGLFSGSSQVNLASVTGNSTTNVSEGTNLYYTDARVKTKLDAETVISGSSQVVGILGALNTFSASASSSLGDIQNYTSSLRAAFTASGANVIFGGNVTIPGNLTISGTQTIVNSTTIQLGDNIIELNGTGVANGGLLVKDPTAPNTVSGSLLWDSTNDYWKAGALGNESKLLRAEGDSVVSGSSQINFTQLSGISNGIVSGSTQTIANLPTGTVSGSSQITYTNISSIPGGIVSGSSQITYTNISSIPSGIVSGSSQITYANISSIPGGIVSGSSQIVSILSSLNTYTGSNDTTNTAQSARLTTIESVTGSYETKGRSIVSGSLQIDVMSTTNIARLATTGSNSFTGNQTITGTINTISIPNDLFAFQFLLMGG